MVRRRSSPTGSSHEGSRRDDAASFDLCQRADGLPGSGSRRTSSPARISSGPPPPGRRPPPPGMPSRDRAGDGRLRFDRHLERAAYRPAFGSPVRAAVCCTPEAQVAACGTSRSRFKITRNRNIESVTSIFTSTADPNAVRPVGAARPASRILFDPFCVQSLSARCAPPARLSGSKLVLLEYSKVSYQACCTKGCCTPPRPT
jgi:hypothetical protein